MAKSALVTGGTDKGGSYLAELLFGKGYEVHGFVLRSSTFSTDHIYCDPHESNAKLHSHYGDLTDGQNLTNLVLDVEPEEIYNLSAQSHVRVSFNAPAYTAQVVGIGALNVLEAAQQLNEQKERVVSLPSVLFGDVWRCDRDTASRTDSVPASIT